MSTFRLCFVKWRISWYIFIMSSYLQESGVHILWLPLFHLKYLWNFYSILKASKVVLFTNNKNIYQINCNNFTWNKPYIVLMILSIFTSAKFSWTRFIKNADLFKMLVVCCVSEYFPTQIWAYRNKISIQQSTKFIHEATVKTLRK